MDRKNPPKLALFLRRLTAEFRDSPPEPPEATPDRKSAYAIISHDDSKQTKRRSWFMRRKPALSRASVDFSFPSQEILLPRRSTVTEKHRLSVVISFDDLIDETSRHRDTTIRISLTPELAQDKLFR